MNASCAATLTHDADRWVGRFVAMACPCEVLIEDAPQALARQVVDTVAAEAWRIERKFSRYRTDSAVHRINETAGSETVVDEGSISIVLQMTVLGCGWICLRLGLAASARIACRH